MTVDAAMKGGKLMKAAKVELSVESLEARGVKGRSIT